VVTFEKAGRALTGGERAFRDAWLASRNPGPAPPISRFCATCAGEFPFAYEFCPYDGKGLSFTRK
jgi:hypothetical protein